MSILDKNLDININFGDMCQRIDVCVDLDTQYGGYVSFEQMELLQKHANILSNKLKRSISKINKIKPSGWDIKRCIADTIHCKANDYNVQQDKCVFDIDSPLHIFYRIRLAKKRFNSMRLMDPPTVIVKGETYRVMEIRVSAKLILKSPQSNYIF